jgi:uncharacterized RDD family membrane protein YckC
VSDAPSQPGPGWYYAQGDPPNTQRYWDGTQWQGGPQPISAPGQVGGSFEAVSAEGNLATPGQRILARLIDAVIWIFVSFFFAVAVGGGTSTMGTTDLGAQSWFAGVLSTLVIVAYEVLMVANKGGTLGKLALGLRVVKEDGSPADLNTAVMRILTYVIGIVPVIGGLISFLIGIGSVVLLFTDKRRQTVWDKIAKTIVVKP